MAGGALGGVGETAGAAAGRASLRLAHIPGFSLAVLAVGSAGLAYAAAVATAPVAPPASVATAFAVGAVTFVLLAKAVGGVLPREDVEVLLGSLPTPIANASRGAVSLLARKMS